MSAAVVSNLLWGAGLMVVAVLTGWRIVGVIRRLHRHHRRANRSFMAGYRAGFRAARTHYQQATLRAGWGRL